MSLRIARRWLDRMARQAEQSYPNECCGILLGCVLSGPRRVEAVWPTENPRAGERGRYQIPATALLQATQQARQNGQEVVGFYHSHPDYPARWSETDRVEAFWTGCSYVIVSVPRGRVGEIRSFLLEADGFVDEPLDVDDEAGGDASAGKGTA